MKTLLFNGCSFVAGDATALELFKKETNNLDLVWGRTLFRNTTAWLAYKDFRKIHGLSGYVGKLLNTVSLNIAQDGNSNENIAISTINFFLNLPKKDYSDYHVCVGWTALARKMKWVEEKSSFFNMNVSNMYEPNNQYLGTPIYNDWIRANLVEATNEDHNLNYIMCILLLENFLKANNITYTFWRSVGSGQDCIAAKKFNNPELYTGQINQNVISEINNWFHFQEDNSNLPWFDGSWANHIHDKNDDTYYVSETNYHPSLIAAREFSVNLSRYIANLDCLNTLTE